MADSAKAQALPREVARLAVKVDLVMRTALRPPVKRFIIDEAVPV